MRTIPAALLLFVAGPGALRSAELLPADQDIHAVIDHYVDRELRAREVQAAGAAPESVLVRRTMLDLVGRIPTVAEVRDYLDSNESGKRREMVDRLIDSPSFVRHQANELDVMLMHGTGKSIREYLERSLEADRRWDEMFRDMLLGDESSAEQQGAIQFVKARVGDLDKLANQASTRFFGINVSCAKCHDHPEVSEWTQAHFYGMKSFFSRTFDNGGFIGERDYGIVKYKTTEGKEHQAQLMYLTGTLVNEPESKEPSDAEKKQQKKTLDELKKKKQAPPRPKFSRRAKLVEIALEENEYFARSIVNRIWHRLLGQGLVMPVDQMHPENPASHPDLLNWLARDLVAHKYDLRRLIRGIVLSKTYARSSRWESGANPSPTLFAVAQVRPLTPHQYGASLKLASSNPDQFAGSMSANDLQKRIAGIESSGRGLAGMFEQPTDDFQISVSEALLLSNSDRIRRDLLRDSPDALLGKMKGLDDVEQALRTAVWSVFCRAPEPEELDALKQYVDGREDRRIEAYRQVVWALLTSSESRFNY